MRKALLSTCLSVCLGLIGITTWMVTTPVTAYADPPGDICTDTTCAEGNKITCCGYTSCGIGSNMVQARNSSGNIVCEKTCKNEGCPCGICDDDGNCLEYLPD